MAPSAKLPAERAASLLDRIRTGDVRAAREATWDELMQLSTLDAAQLPAGEQMPVDASEMGEGFVVVPKEGKKHLVGVPFFVVGVDVNEGKRFGGYFASLRIVTQYPVDHIRPGCRTFIVNDGGTGVCRQIVGLRHAKELHLPMACRHGLRVSEYTVTQDQVDDDGNTVYDETTLKAKQVPVLNPLTGEETKGQTYYLDESP